MPAFLDVLTGAPGHEAAQNQRNTLGAIVPNLALTGQEGYRQAGDFLRGGFNTARNDLTAGYGQSTDAIRAGATGALDYLNQGQQGALGQLGQARSDLTANGGAFAPLSDLASRYGQGSALYSDALGINGPQGNQNAVSAFQAGPGYDFALNQGIDAINRKRNAAGSLVGGNADRDAQVFGQGLANQEYGSWLNRLQGFQPLELSATQGAATGNQQNANTLANLGVAGSNLLNTGGQNRASVASGQGNSLADLANRFYGGLAGNDVASGNALAGNAIGGAQNWQGVFQNALPQFNNTFQQDAKATNDAGANQINLGMNLAKLAVGAAGGGGFGLPNFTGPAAGKDFAGLGGWA